MPDTSKKLASFRIVSAEPDQFAYLEENRAKNKENTETASDISFSYDTSSRMLKCTCSVKYQENKALVLIGGLSVTFELSSDTIDHYEQTDKLEIPQDLLVFFATHTYGALRGMLIAKLESTAFRWILPIVSIKDLITTPFRIPR